MLLQLKKKLLHGKYIYFATVDFLNMRPDLYAGRQMESQSGDQRA